MARASGTTGIRQWRCLNGHSVTWNPAHVVRRVYAWVDVCDTCRGLLLVPAAAAHGHPEQVVRHERCDAAHARGRMRRARGGGGVDPLEGVKPPEMGSRCLTSLALSRVARPKNFTPRILREKIRDEERRVEEEER